MERIERINNAGIAYLMAETEFSSMRLMGSVGKKVRDAKRAAEAARDELVQVFRESGYTLDEVEAMRTEDGRPLLVYGIADVLKKEL